MSLTPSPPSPSSPRVRIDHAAFPHILDAILENTPFAFCKTLRATSLLALRLMRFELSGLRDYVPFPTVAPTVVVFVAPQALSGPAQSITTSDDPLFPPAARWCSHFRRQQRIPPSILHLPKLDIATERLAFNLHINPEHDMFAQWEIDFTPASRGPLEIYVIATRDNTPLAHQHTTPRGTPRFQGRILNRLLFAIARQIVFCMPHTRVRVAFVDAHTWDHGLLATSFVDKSCYCEIDEEMGEQPTMQERIAFWLTEVAENQYEQYHDAPFTEVVETFVRFITLGEFRNEIPEDDYIFGKILCP
ncbi:hypothetical protein CspeluHIS016_0303270 [Cutaneotrichosporon spelunceum]|uniref:Uncharacterized protein n=1 Tax=Cutaneotrichosporon spelunceum TaxID=1672016 RepID=A0AAD3TTZ2_9TREE|nr:hypothetical protein CspeluHIS016_0303270 [Cutaneotrichosporon spelunceum]